MVLMVAGAGYIGVHGEIHKIVYIVAGIKFGKMDSYIIPSWVICVKIRRKFIFNVRFCVVR